MRRDLLCLAVFAIVIAGGANAQVTVFDFNCLSPGDGDAVISDYMSSVYGSTVETDRARVGVDRGFGLDPYVYNSNLAGDFAINFVDAPITAARFRGHIFGGSDSGHFGFRAYRNDVLVSSFDYYEPPLTFVTPWIYFSDPVDELVFTDSSRHDVAIDNLRVVPAPGAVILGMIGLGLIGRMKRVLA